MFHVNEVRKDFPILSSQVNGRSLVYLDNAATTQMPLCVMDRIRQHYCHDNANVHRGIHTLSERSTKAYDSARETVRGFLHAENVDEIVFTQGTTDSINMVASGLRRRLHENNSIVVTELEHHSNFLPWQRLCNETGATFIVVPCLDGEMDMDFFRKAMQHNPALVAVTQVSNLTGTVMPLEEIIPLAHEAGALVLVDGAQGIRHESVDVSRMDCDFYCFSGHKIMGPSGIGVLYGKRRALELLEPARVGGGMVDTVGKEHSTYGVLPFRLEAGTPNYPGAIGLAEAMNYIDALGKTAISEYEHGLVRYAEDALLNMKGLTVLGHPARRSGVISFVIEGVHPYDAASVVDKFGVALRSGTHCAQPALQTFNLQSALRLSPAFYNTREEIDFTCDALRRTTDIVKKWMNK